MSGDILRSLIAEVIEMPIVRSFSVGVPALGAELRIYMWLLFSCCLREADLLSRDSDKFMCVRIITCLSLTAHALLTPLSSACECSLRVICLF